MGIQDNQPPPSRSGETRSSEAILSSLIEQLETVHQQVKHELSADIERLQKDKNRLIENIEQLHHQYDKLQNQHQQALSERQFAQQQVWLKQLAQVLASNLQRELVARINRLRTSSDQPLLTTDPSGLQLPSSLQSDLSATELEAVLDTSLNDTFRELQQELSTYQSDLSQRLSHMQSLEQQVEMLLETVVSRLKNQIDRSAIPNGENQPETSTKPSVSPVRPQPTVIEGSKPPSPPTQPTSSVQLGLFLALMSAVALSLFNVCLKIILQGPEPRQIFGLFEIEGIISPGLGNSLLILLLRMIVVMALMPVVATFLYPAVWSDMKRFIQSRDTSLMLTVIGSGFFLFLSQVCIYIAIGEIPTGIAITIFFIYPIVTVLASWGLFGDRPTLIRVIAMVIILGGGVLCLPSFFGGAAGNTQVGIIASVGAGVAFAGYVLLTQMAAGKLHPIPFSLVNFASIFVFCCVSLIFLPDNLSMDVDVNVWQGLMFGGVVLGVLTLCSYLFQNFAIRSAGAALASIIGTSGPALTALFAFFIIGEALTPKQILGMALVILGVGAMSFERLVKAKKKAA
ncbi:triose-phosphate Transporter family protein [Lyngbya aestuarii BL J]|uniref:Triose-phosphate Transporter family protein n=1 Tax=Lyngbya aestuarii BL J TaxID=1348334 RepID=U7QJR9_9CYAN|nr:DMT family transporter [Lyngbya aestuarii]ERT07497.1 triose-phosphate Transporter family protein [Lyngbya aestuarii BL J]